MISSAGIRKGIALRIGAREHPASRPPATPKPAARRNDRRLNPASFCDGVGSGSPPSAASSCSIDIFSTVGLPTSFVIASSQ